MSGKMLNDCFKTQSESKCLEKGSSADDLSEKPNSRNQVHSVQTVLEKKVLMQMDPSDDDNRIRSSVGKTSTSLVNAFAHRWPILFLSL
ncbi:hypothetical protein HDU92_002855 [Lobulomyces angularis]|nr:hypothetical protein HDU92_002855 [Lobulomyces angularis]